MIIDLIKHCDLFKSLSLYNYDLNKLTRSIKFAVDGIYDLEHDVISEWFNPKKVRDLNTSRNYPDMVPEQYRKEYCLSIICSNYLGLFLIDKLYSDKKDVSIEDFGGGLGYFFFYLSKLGFNNFNIIDNWSQTSENCTKNFLKRANLSVKLNDTNPSVVTQNVGVPWFINSQIDEKTELIILYTNRKLEERAKEALPERNFSFLCRDGDDFAVAYCRNDKLQEFTQKLASYEKSEEESGMSGEELQ